MNAITRPDVEKDGELAVVMWDLLTEVTGPYPDQGIVYFKTRRIHELTAFEPLDICNALAAWARVADVESPRAGKGYLAVGKSDLLYRLIYGGEQGPSETPCPVHLGRWSGCHFGWPGSVWRSAEGETPVTEDPKLRKWWDAGCRCATHRGSSCTTGWNPDAACGCAIVKREQE